MENNICCLGEPNSCLLSRDQRVFVYSGKGSERSRVLVLRIRPLCPLSLSGRGADGARVPAVMSAAELSALLRNEELFAEPLNGVHESESVNETDALAPWL